MFVKGNGLMAGGCGYLGSRDFATTDLTSAACLPHHRRGSTRT